MYIRANAGAASVFDENDTHVGYYNNFLNPKDLKYMQEVPASIGGGMDGSGM